MSYTVSYENLYLDDLKESFPRELTHILPLHRKETQVLVETKSSSLSSPFRSPFLPQMRINACASVVGNLKCFDMFL